MAIEDEVVDKYPELTKAEVVDYWHECQTEHHKRNIEVKRLQEILKENNVEY